MHYDNKKIAQIAKIAFLYYKKNKNQEEISKLMSIARPTISKLISEAKDLSLVDFKIKYPWRDKELEKQMDLNKNQIIDLFDGIEKTRKNSLVYDPSTYMTATKGVFACGDVVLGASTVIQAVNSAKIVSESMHEYLQEVAEEAAI